MTPQENLSGADVARSGGRSEQDDSSELPSWGRPRTAFLVATQDRKDLKFLHYYGSCQLVAEPGSLAQQHNSLHQDHDNCDRSHQHITDQRNDHA